MLTRVHEQYLQKKQQQTRVLGLAFVVTNCDKLYDVMLHWGSMNLVTLREEYHITLMHTAQPFKCCGKMLQYLQH